VHSVESQLKCDLLVLLKIYNVHDSNLWKAQLEEGFVKFFLSNFKGPYTSSSRKINYYE